MEKKANEAAIEKLAPSKKARLVRWNLTEKDKIFLRALNVNPD